MYMYINIIRRRKKEEEKGITITKFQEKKGPTLAMTLICAC